MTKAISRLWTGDGHSIGGRREAIREERSLLHLRRQILVRFLLCGLMLAALAATGFYCLGLSQRDHLVLDMALSQGRHIAYMLAGQTVAGEERHWSRFLGDFAFVCIEWEDHVDEIGGASLPLTRQVLSSFVTKFNQTLGHQDIEIDGTTYLLVSAPIADPELRVERFVGLYRVDPSVTRSMKRQLWWSVAAVMATVIVVTVVLLPVIRRLEGGLIRHAREAIEANIGTLKALGGAVAKRDGLTEAHNHRVTVYAVRLAEQLSMTDDQIRCLIRGALLHDVGKIGTPDHVLRKPGKLTPQEFDVMKRHVPDGVDIIRSSPSLLSAADVVKFHHERMDGSGYPQGVRGPDIPLAARIFSVVDVFDALTSSRPYKAALPLAEAQTILRKGRGTQFDPAVLDAFLPISDELYREVGEGRDDRAQVALDTLVHRYFVSDVFL